MTSAVVQTIETQAHRIINQKDGVIRVYSKPSHIEKEDVEALFAAFAEFRGEEKLYVLHDPTEENSMTNEARSYIMKHMKDNVAAYGVVGRKQFVRSVFAVVSKFVDIGVELNMFENEAEVEKWLRTKLK